MLRVPTFEFADPRWPDETTLVVGRVSIDTLTGQVSALRLAK